MNNAIAITPTQQSLGKIEQILIRGDLSSMNEGERLTYYKSVCDTVGLNPLTKPFDYITLNGKLVLYAKRDATDQLRKIYNVSIKITGRETIEGVYVVTAQARMPSGREDESTGAVHTASLKGDMLANAYMKAETKAKRRVTLSICGLGILDETEVADIPAKDKGPSNPGPGRIVPEQPTIADGDIEPACYKFTTKWPGKTVEQVYQDPKNGRAALVGYLDFLDKVREEKGLSARAQEAYTEIENFLGFIENKPIEKNEVTEPGWTG